MSTRIYRLDLDSSGWMDPIQQSLRCFVDFGGNHPMGIHGVPNDLTRDDECSAKTLTCNTSSNGGSGGTSHY